VKIASISSSAPQYRGCSHNLVWLNIEPENETEKALMRTLAAHLGKVHVYSDGTTSLEFRPIRRKHN
jgi:hypothetical protein